METREEKLVLADKVKNRCLSAAREAFEEASMSGLCMEGAVEAALGAIESIDLEKILKDSD